MGITYGDDGLNYDLDSADDFWYCEQCDEPNHVTEQHCGHCGYRQIYLPCFDMVVTLAAEGGAITSSIGGSPAFDSIESLVLAHAVAGIDIESSRYVDGIKTAVNGVINNE